VGVRPIGKGDQELEKRLDQKELTLGVLISILQKRKVKLQDYS
jgi:hypothetical protein